MSWQSSLLNVVLRLSKWSMKKKNFVEAQASLGSAMSRAEKSSTLPNNASSVVETINAVPCEWVTVGDSAQSKQVVMYFHGGAFMVGSPSSHRDLAWRLSQSSGMKVLVVDYRLTPEHIFPAPLDDAIAVYEWLLNNGYENSDIAFAGDSAGGNMTLSVMLAAKDKSLPLPAAGICISPWADLTHSGDSIESNKNRDPMLPVNVLADAAKVYAGEVDLADPKVSPIFGDFSGFPPLMVFCGSTEILLSDALRITEQAKQAAVEVDYKAWHKQAHAFPAMAQFIPEARQAILDMGSFLKLKMRDS